jgi:hypothetical protein
MRLFVAIFAFAVLSLALPSIARAECPGSTAASALRDKVVDAKVHSSKLTGTKAELAIANLKKGIGLAESCMSVGSAGDRAATLGVIAQLRWNQACVLTFDGVASHKPAAVRVAKASDAEMDAFSSKNPSISADAQVLFHNWEHFDDDIESGNPDSCLQ